MSETTPSIAPAPAAGAVPEAAPPTAAEAGLQDSVEERRALSRPAVSTPHTLRYGDHPEQVYDLWPGPGPDAPTVVLLHGGFWKQAFDRAHLSPLAAALAAAGFTAVLAEYRRTGGDGGFPNTLDDMALLLDTVPAADPPLLLGHSAGGHLALWAASRRRLPSDTPWHGGRSPRGVLALAPVADLAAAVRDGLGSGAGAAFLGHAPGGPDRVVERLPFADPLALAPTGVPTVLLHGEDDRVVPLAQSLSYAAADPAVRLTVLPGTDHFQLIDPDAPAFAALLAGLRSFG
jgi:acetyl esterase/lipase